MNKPEEKSPKKKRADGQITGLAGEFYVAAELLKRGLQTSVTFGNAKSIDLFAHNPVTDRTFTVQVKTLRKKNVFPISHERIEATCIYVFVILNKPDEAVQYFIVPGKILKDERDRFQQWFWDPKFPGIQWRIFQEQGFENAWYYFEQPR